MSIQAMRRILGRAVQATPRPSTEDSDSMRWDRQLDEALKDTFPASDPPSVVVPHSFWKKRNGLTVARRLDSLA